MNWNSYSKQIKITRLKFDKIKSLEKRKTAQYLGEGITFFLLIVAGAVFVFRAVQT